MKFFTKYDRPETKGEVNTGEIKVDKFDYIPPNVQIERMIRAGERLKVARREDYEFSAEDVIPDDYINPTQNPDFDLADVTTMQQKWEAAKAEIEAKAAMDAETKAEAQNEKEEVDSKEETEK